MIVPRHTAATVVAALKPDVSLEIARSALAQALITEGDRLLAVKPYCHEMRNELGAAVLIAKLYAKGFDVTLADAEGCLARMRTVIET
jgi:hypothetical protein